LKKYNAKFLFRIFALVITINLVFALFPKQISAQQNELNYQEFYDQLISYGQWMENPNYGYVWIPSAGPDFAPYLTNGYWMLTTYGWMWVSGYDWGWAAFHYGRWDYNGSYGWFWVPDNEWGPSWVTWRRSEGYYGWAPMRPGVSISVTFGSYNDVPADRWIFVKSRDIENHDIGWNHIDRKKNYNIIKNSTVVNKTYYDDKRRATYVAGPSTDEVQKNTGRSIYPVTVSEKDKPGQSFRDDQMQIYRPQVQKNKNNNNSMPRKITKLKDLKSIAARESEKHPVVNFNNTLNINRPAYQTPNLDQPRKENRINQSQQQKKVDIPKRNDNTVQSRKPQNLDSHRNETRNDRLQQLPKVNMPVYTNPVVQTSKAQPSDSPEKENRTDRTHQQNINIPRNNNGAGQFPKAQPVNPSRANNADRPDKNNTDDDKKVNGKR
jgi:hypothetical protein